MNGQLWEPCPICGDEPVCSECGYCETHCECRQRRAERQQIQEFEKQNPGFLEGYSRHIEQGASEH